MAEEVGTDPGRLRIAFTPTGIPLHYDCVAAVRDAAALCADLGHEVTEASPKLDGEMLSRSFTTVWAAGTVWTIDSIAYATGLQPTPEQFERFTVESCGAGSAHYLVAVPAGGAGAAAGGP